MVEHLPSSEPLFKIDAAVSAEERERIISLEKSIKERPLQFQVLFSKMGDIAIGAAPPEDVEVEGDDITRVRWYFDKREDGYVEFDDATEQSLTSSRRFAELKQERAQVERGSSEADKERARDKFRIFRLQHFAGRAVAWQELQANQQETGAQDEDPKAEAPDNTLGLPYPAKPEQDENLLTA